MKTQEIINEILVKYQKEADHLLTSTASKNHAAKIINEPCKIIDEVTGECLVLYTKTKDRDLPMYRYALKSIPYKKHYRTNGIPTNSTHLWSLPRNPERFDGCTEAASSFSHPDECDIIEDNARDCAKLYKEQFPEIYQKHCDIIEGKNGQKKFHSDYIVPETPFTSGIINYNNSLRYHRDMANIAGVFSVMLVLKAGIVGGCLILPELNIGFDMDDCSIIMFDGRKLIHGVTPIYPANGQSGGYRYSVVYYTMKNICNCLPVEEELERIKIKPMKRRQYGNI